MSPWSTSISRPRPTRWTLRRARSSMMGEMSIAVTAAPNRRAIWIAVVPTPQPTSSAFCPSWKRARSKSSSVDRRPPGWITRLPSTAINAYGSSELTSIFGRESVVAISRPPFRHGDHWKACGLPLRQSVFEPSGMKPGLFENPNGLMGKRAVGAAAVGHDFFVAGQFAQPSAEFSKGDRDRGGQMTGRELFRRSDIEDDDVFSPLQPPE